MVLDDIRLPRPEIQLGTAEWLEYLSMEGLPPDFLNTADQAAFYLLVTRADGEIVAAALAYDFADDCGIYNVGAVEKARRRGLGTALTAAQAYAARPRLPVGFQNSATGPGPGFYADPRPSRSGHPPATGTRTASGYTASPAPPPGSPGWPIPTPTPSKCRRRSYPMWSPTSRSASLLPARQWQRARTR